MDISSLKRGTGGAQELAEMLHRQHRSTQADLVGTILQGLGMWADQCQGKPQQRMDIRNQHAVNVVLKMLGSERPDYRHTYTC